MRCISDLSNTLPLRCISWKHTERCLLFVWLPGYKYKLEDESCVAYDYHNQQGHVLRSNEDATSS